MSERSSVDWTTSPPTVTVPRDYNAAVDIVERNLQDGRGDKISVIDDQGQYTYAELAQRIDRAGNMLSDLGLAAEQRVVMCMLDSVDFMATFWGAIKIGAVPVPINTMLTSADYDFMLSDSRARILVVSRPLYEKFQPAVADQSWLKTIIVAGGEAPAGTEAFAKRLEAAADSLAPAATSCDDAAFWLYSSGSTGMPKGVVHYQSDIVQTAALYGAGVLGMREDDTVFSAAKLFFAYGLGNAMTFPFYVGATAVLVAERARPASVMRRLKDHQPTIFFGVPTLYGAILADSSLDKRAGSDQLRICVSAGEALPEEIARRWVDRFGVDILDGIGSTEMLHIFLSNQPGDIRYGTTGKAVPGYELKLVDEHGDPVPPGEIGELLVNGPSSPMCYWNNREKSRATFLGPWTRTGDKYSLDENGYYVYSGRSDDMLKVGGIWVSPFEVESALLAHEAVLEAAVVGATDEDDLVKPKAYVVLNEGRDGSEALIEELKAFVKGRLAPYKYPRWVTFVDELPKTATGKIQRFKLRD